MWRIELLTGWLINMKQRIKRDRADGSLKSIARTDMTKVELGIRYTDFILILCLNWKIV